MAFKRRKATSILNQQLRDILKVKQAANTVAGDEKDILDLLLKCENENGEMLSKEELIEQSKTFLLAGYETSSTALLWAMYALAHRPLIQQQLAEEVIKDWSDLNVENIDKLPLLDRVVKETLRWRPPIPFLPRLAAEDTKLGDYFIPKGTLLIVHTYVQHHDPKYWPNADEFDPDRWLTCPEDIMFNGSYIPFLLGPRNCIGSKFALLEIKVMLAIILQHIKFTPVQKEDDIKRVAKVTMFASPDILLRVSPRSDKK